MFNTFEKGVEWHGELSKIGIQIEINKSKTKLMKNSRNGSSNYLNTKTGYDSVEEMDEFNYLVNIIAKKMDKIK